jgi:hypothetical protein
MPSASGFGTRPVAIVRNVFVSEQIKRSSIFPARPNSIDRHAIGHKIYSSFSGSRFKISGKGGSPAPRPCKQMLQVKLLLIDCLLPAQSQVHHYPFKNLSILLRMIWDGTSTTCEMHASFASSYIQYIRVFVAAWTIGRMFIGTALFDRHTVPCLFW